MALATRIHARRGAPYAPSSHRTRFLTAAAAIASLRRPGSPALPSTRSKKLSSTSKRKPTASFASPSNGGGGGDDPLVRAARSAASVAAAAAEKLKLKEILEATSKAASEAASSADARWNLRSRARALAVDARRLAPYYGKKVKAFAATPFGQASAVGALLLLLYTGILGKLLNLAFLVYWLAPLLLLPLAQAGAAKEQKERQRRAQEEEAARRRATWGPAADWFGGGGGNRSYNSSSEGDIIDVEVEKKD